MKIKYVFTLALAVLSLIPVVAKADNSIDCDDFNTQTEAQTFYWNKRTSEKLDLAALDHDEDGIACEHLDGSYSLVNRNRWDMHKSQLRGMSILENTILWNVKPVRKNRNTIYYHGDGTVKLLVNGGIVVKASFMRDNL